MDILSIRFCIEGIKLIVQRFFASKRYNRQKKLGRCVLMNPKNCEWHIPFFVNVSEEKFVQEIRALGFNQNAKGDLIRPLLTNGGQLSIVYRFYYFGNRIEDGQSVFTLILSMYEKSYATGIECTVQDTEQTSIIRRAEKNNFARGAMNGLFTGMNQISIVCMNDKTVLQKRRKIYKHHLESIMKDISSVKDELIGEKFDLFTMDDERGLLFA